MRKPGRGAQWKPNSPEASALQGFLRTGFGLILASLTALLRTAWRGGRGQQEEDLILRGVASFHGAGPLAEGGTVGGHTHMLSEWVSEPSPPRKGRLISFSGHSYLSYPASCQVPTKRFPSTPQHLTPPLTLSCGRSPEVGQ